jgi:hypothetical protein
LDASAIQEAVGSVDEVFCCYCPEAQVIVWAVVWVQVAVGVHKAKPCMQERCGKDVDTVKKGSVLGVGCS